MQVKVGSELFYLQVIHYQEELPIQLESRYVNPKSVPEFIDQDFQKQTATGYLLGQFRPDEMEHIVQAVMPEKKIAQYLMIKSDEPCLKLSRRTWIGSQIVTWSNMLYPSSRYDLAARYKT